MWQKAPDKCFKPENLQEWELRQMNLKKQKTKWTCFNWHTGETWELYRQIKLLYTSPAISMPLYAKDRNWWIYKWNNEKLLLKLKPEAYMDLYMKPDPPWRGGLEMKEWIFQHWFTKKHSPATLIHGEFKNILLVFLHMLIFE